MRGLAVGSSRVQEMTAFLPLAFTTAYGEERDEPRVAGLAEDLFIAAMNLVRMEKRATFEDSEVPQATLLAGLAAADALLGAMPPEALSVARKRRCAKQLSEAASMEDMRDVANDRACQQLVTMP